MTVYDLIQVLAKHPADAEVEFKVLMFAFYNEPPIVSFCSAEREENSPVVIRLVKEG